MHSLYLASDLFAAIDDGTKTSTIRLGKRDIQEGDLIFQSADGPLQTRQVIVTNSYHIKWSELSLREAHSDACTSIESLKTLLRRFYPEVQDNDIMTVILFKRNAT